MILKQLERGTKLTRGCCTLVLFFFPLCPQTAVHVHGDVSTQAAEGRRWGMHCRNGDGDPVGAVCLARGVNVGSKRSRALGGTKQHWGRRPD